MAPILQVRLLGTFELRYGDEAVTSVDSARVQSLLAYLLLNGSAPQLRQHVASLFWPDSTEAQARGNLRKVLLLLRRALPDADDSLHVTAKTLQWRADAPVELDVDRFEQDLTAYVRHLDPKLTVDYNYHGNPPFAWEVGQRPVQHADNGDFVTGETGTWAFGALSVSLNAAFYRAATPGRERT